MLKQHARFVDLCVRLADLILFTLALPAAHFAYAHAPMARWGPPPIEILWVRVVAVLLLWITASAISQVYGTYRTRGIIEELGRIARALALVAVVTLAVLFSADTRLPRLLIGLYFAIASGLLVSSRLVVRMTARALRRSGYNMRRYAIVGTGSAAEEVAITFAKHPQWGFELAGFILLDEAPVRSPSGRVLGSLSDLARILDEQVLDEIVFAVPRERLNTIEPAVKMCEDQGVTVVVSLEPLHLGMGRMSLFELSDLSMLVFIRTPSDILPLAAKRLFDIVVSLAAMIVLTPVFLIVAAAIRLESRGPVFFKQTRVGLNGRPFTMVKFRSMFRDAEQRLQALRALNEVSGPVFKMKNDPRVTRVGRFIRKTSIDELPQFWNVFRGQMSIVGPRPPIPSEVQQYQRWQRRRLSVRPGLTCTWQVSGRSGISFDRWMELDLEYIDNWSLWQDMQICLKTIPAVITARGAQ
ncbi:sugar transferase [Vulgatibacter incomptus]|uniref:Undecaprenyl-phosphate galactosephosphotransferase n=1 Tax=Vulgatibacter incomptus TaxID=1391653 RepID=A0A0K1P8K0_9BACT|nr:sugar transferase [Vulgatibacter incomptus]AKU89858.1 Undecaprenyl-phosphate galactosephosphotransferase [Vulgatibacter incomptus]